MRAADSQTTRSPLRLATCFTEGDKDVSRREDRSEVGTATPPVAAEPKAETKQPERVLIKMLMPAKYTLRGVTYEQGKVYEVAPSLRDYLVGQPAEYEDAVGNPLHHFVDFVPAAARAEAEERTRFIPLTKEGAELLAAPDARRRLQRRPGPLPSTTRARSTPAVRRGGLARPRMQRGGWAGSAPSTCSRGRPG